MHENRETSETPAVQPDSRSAYVCEESHSGILPMNHSNKDRTPSAESAEGRPLIKENVCQPNTYPTQAMPSFRTPPSGLGISTRLTGFGS